MRNLLKKISWVIDYYLMYFMYNERKKIRYHRMMVNKWGKKYIQRITQKKY